MIRYETPLPCAMDAEPAVPGLKALPCHFGAVELPMSGWYHPAAKRSSPVAVLICPPIGDEAIAVHRGLRRLAIDLAACGMPTLRFDPAGTGDSADPPDLAEGDQLDVWLRSIEAAASALRAASGAHSIALVGVRHGGLLAAHAAFAIDGVSALVAVVPVTDGRGYLRECRMLGSSLGQEAASDGSVLAGGHRYNPATARRLEALDWRRTDGAAVPPLPQALVIDRDDRPSGSVCAERLRLGGTVVTLERHADLDRLTTMAHQSVLPAPVAARIVDWLAGIEAAAAPTAADPDLSVLRAGPARIRVADGEVIEERVLLGNAPMLAGLVTRRADVGAAGGRGILMLASGSERLVGAHRIFTRYARERAALGDVVLRIDRAGIGDSEVRPGGPENEPFDAAAIGDVEAGLAFLRKAHGVDACCVVGFCAGAYHGWRTAVAGADIDCLVSVNPIAYSAGDDKDVDPRAAALHLALLAKTRRSLLDWQQWRQLLRGELRLRGIAIAAAGRARGLGTDAVRRAARAVGRPMADDLAIDLAVVGRRGVRQRFIFSENEPGWSLLRSQGAGALKRLMRKGQLQVQTLTKADHSCTSQASQEALRAALHAALDGDEGGGSAGHGVRRKGDTLAAQAPLASR